MKRNVGLSKGVDSKLTAANVGHRIATKSDRRAQWQQPRLTEIRSITVRRDHVRRGLGRSIVRALLRRARGRDVCLFTRAPAFFAAFGFQVIDRTRVPEKFYKDCRLCPRRHACDETAMAIGDLALPLHREARELVVQAR